MMIDVNALSRMRTSHVLEPYISHIRFPHYKSIVANTQINFDFPITALVGPNGSNKSSVLKALFGAPENNNLGTRWFSTSVDPISDTGGRPRFIYGYWNERTQQVVEVIKTRIKRTDNPDYWEPSRPLSTDGMTTPPKLESGQLFSDRSKTRWNPISKSVVYIDFRSELSAFDQYFYFGDLRRSSRIKTKQDFIRQKSVHLKRIIDESLDSFLMWGKEKITSNAIFTEEQLKAASTILGKDYSSIRMIEHSLFGHFGTSAVLSTKGLQYSEAFAGSGEFAVLMMVKQITEVPKHALILLDEPEVSLHPGAQEKLIQFLAFQVKNKKHQVVMSTHAPTMIRQLPPDAIKVFQVDPLTAQASVLSRSTASEAFYHLGEPQPNLLRILVEDRLGQELIRKVLRLLPLGIRPQVNVEVFPGGAETLLKSYARVFAVENRTDTIVLLDGDKDRGEMPDPNMITIADNQTLQSTILQFTGVDLPVFSDGGVAGGNVAQLYLYRRQFMSWFRKYVKFLPCQTPEEFIWTAAPSSLDMQSVQAVGYKDRFKELAQKRFGLTNDETVSADDILSVQRSVLAEIDSQNQEIINLGLMITGFVEALGMNL